MHVYIVKTRDGYLYPFGDDVSLSDLEEQAGHFLSAAEARSTAESMGYYDGGFQILGVDVSESNLNRWERAHKSG